MSGRVRFGIVVLLGLSFFLLQPAILRAGPVPSCLPDPGACTGNTGAVGEAACLGAQSCESNSGNVAKNGCHEWQACLMNQGAVGEGACHGEQACLSNLGNIRKAGCIGPSACAGNIGAVGEGACIDADACNGNTGDIGKLACHGFAACQARSGPVGDGACIGLGACSTSGPGEIGKGACRGDKACANNPGPIRKGACVGPPDPVTGKGVCEISVAPTITGCDPDLVPAGGEDFDLTVDGTDFTEVHVVRWNGSNRVTTFISGTRLRGRILRDDIAEIGPATVTVADGQGGNVSNPFIVTITDE